MNVVFLVTALLVIPAGFLIVIGDEIDPLAEARRIVRKNAKRSGDRTQLRFRLEELGRGTEKDYVDFRIRQYGYSAATSAIGFTILLILTHSQFLSLFGSRWVDENKTFLSNG